MMWSTLLLAICGVGGNLALDESEWRDMTVKLSYKASKSYEQHDYDKYVDLFDDDGKGLFPNGPIAKKKGMKPIIDKMSISSEYVAFLELLYSSPDVAITRQVGYRKQMDGTVKNLKGVLLLVQENGKGRIKMLEYNSD